MESTEHAWTNRVQHGEAGEAPEVSIVVPCCEEAENVPQLYAELLDVMRTFGHPWEVIFIDDGSRDATWETISALHQRDNRVAGLRLSRNFGHQNALLAGMLQARGRAVITMDADLQHPPQVIPRLIDEWKKGSKVVHTIRIDSKDLSSAKRLTSQWFYRAFSSLSGVRMEPGMADFRLLDGQVVNNLLRLPEQGMFLRGLVHWVGYPSSRVTFQARERASGRSKYTFWRMLQFAWNGVTSFSVVPLRLGVLLGFLTSIVAFGELIYAIYMKATGRTVPGWASAVGVVSLLFGILFVLIGITGEYVGRILIEVRSRPRFLISECVGVKGPLRED